MEPEAEREESLGHLASSSPRPQNEDLVGLSRNVWIDAARFRTGGAPVAGCSGSGLRPRSLLSAILDEQTATGWRTAGTTLSPVAPELIEALARSGQITEATGLLDHFEADATDLAARTRSRLGAAVEGSCRLPRCRRRAGVPCSRTLGTAPVERARRP